MPDQDWKVANPSDVGFVGKNLCFLLKNISDNKLNLHSLLIEKNEKLIAEIYFNGSDSSISQMYGLKNPFSGQTSFDSEILHDQRSISKSIIGILIGISVDKKLISLDSKLSDYYLIDSKKLINPEKSIELKHLLTMSSGISWNEMEANFFNNNEIALVWQSNPAQKYFLRDSVSNPGATFNYSGGSTMVLSNLLEIINKKPLLQLVEDDLFSPLNIKKWEWVRNLKNIPMSHAGLKLRPRDMLKMGRLVLNKGRWNDQQIVSTQWVNDMIYPQIKTNIDFLSLSKSNASYGYHWWNGEILWKEKILKWSSAIGNGGQRIFIIPDLNLNIAITAGDYNDRKIQIEIGKILTAIVEGIEY